MSNLPGCNMINYYNDILNDKKDMANALNDVYERCLKNNGKDCHKIKNDIYDNTLDIAFYQNKLQTSITKCDFYKNQD